MSSIQVVQLIEEMRQAILEWRTTGKPDLPRFEDIQEMCEHMLTEDADLEREALKVSPYRPRS